MDDAADFVRRQCDYLESVEGPDYLRHLRRCLNTFLGEPRIRPILLDINREAQELVRAYVEHDNETVGRLRELRADLVRRFPWADDSGVTLPPGGDPVMSGWTQSLAYFDQVAARPPDSHEDRQISALGLEDASRSGKLAALLRAKSREFTQEAIQRGQERDVEDFGAALSRIEETHTFVHRNFLNDKLTSAGTALDQCILAIEQMNRAPDRDWGTMSLRERMHEAMVAVMRGDRGMEEFLYESSASGDARDLGEGRIKLLRPAMRRLQEELLLRIGKRRSLLGLLDRFRARCEWHDRDRLRNLAASARRRAEEVLTAELSRWLFDQGLTPFSKPLVGGLQPDLLDPTKLYVEAKRYRAASGSRGHIVRGMWQVHDTVARLRGTPHSVNEAFYVVFREAGPRYVLPESVPGEGWTVFPVLVDIAPLTEAGSRQRVQPITISTEDLAPRRR